MPVSFLLGIIFFTCVISNSFAVPISIESNTAIPGEGLQAEGYKEWQRAISIYLDSLSKNPNRIELWIRIATIEHQLKNFTLAIDAYRHAILLQPNNPTLHKTLSEIYAELNQPEAAFIEVNEAVKLSPNDIDYLQAKSNIANWNKKYAIALESEQQLLGLHKKGNILTNPVEILTKIGNLQTQLHHYPEAIEAYNSAIQINPNHVELYKNLSQIYASEKKPEMALVAIEQALKLEPNNTQFLLAKANFATWLQNYKLAKETYQHILKLSPNDTMAIKGLALIDHLIKIAKIKPLSPVEKLINEANNEAVLHHYNQAAQGIKQAIVLKPNDPDLYKKLSEVYATAKRPQLAFSAINKATQLSPSNVGYWRARATLASWAGDKEQTLVSYDRILQLKPYDQDAMLNLSHTLAWQGKTDEALNAYRQLLGHYPLLAEGWIQYADVLSWTGNFIDAYDATRHYKQIKGNTTQYLETQARILALNRRYKSSLALNDTLLRSKPNDPYLLATEVTDLTYANQSNKAIDYLKKLNKVSLNDPQVKGLNNITLTPLRTRFNLETDFTGASDTTRIIDVPVGVQYFLSPQTSFLLLGLYERANAAAGNFLDPIGRTGTVADESIKAGFTTQINSLNLKAVAGGLHIQQGNNHGIYDASVNMNVGERAQVTVENLHDLFRPYLVPQTPRLISLQIMETRIAGYLQWQPFVQKYMNVTMSYSQLSDANSYFHANVWPKARVYASEHWQVSVGVDSDLWSFQRRATDGYYSPLFFEGYEGTVEFYYAQSENIGFGFSGGFGMQKDETFPHFFYEEDLAAQVFLGIFTDWELQAKSGYTLRVNQFGKYQCWAAGLVLTRRF